MMLIRIILLGCLLLFCPSCTKVQSEQKKAEETQRLIQIISVTRSDSSYAYSGSSSGTYPFASDRWGENYIANLSRNDCRALARKDYTYCDTDDCKGMIRKSTSYCDTDDCRGFVNGSYSYCRSNLCKAWVRKDSSYCSSSESGYDDCRALAKDSYTYCKSSNCKAIIKEDSTYCY